MALLLTDGKITTLNGKLFIDTNGTDCCCLVLPCDCSSMPDTLNGRVVWSGVNCPPTSDPGVCEFSGTSYFTLTSVTPIPDDLEAPCTAGKYFTATVDNPCSEATAFVEFICCQALGTAQYYMRVDGGSWWLMAPPQLVGYTYDYNDCQCAVGLPSGQFNPFGINSCCGTSALYVYWGQCVEPPIVCGDTGPP